MGRIELLSPAGDMEALIAAVQNGADAVYAGGRGFGARANASSFDGEGLVSALDYCHKRGVKFYMTINTLVKDSEMEAVYALAKDAVEAGIDGSIVQDLGVLQMLRTHFPSLHLHASTQMTILNAKGAELAKNLGVSRVVPARECTLEDISLMAKTGLEVEVFVHGALCVGVSGQCLLSSMIGGRSGNRGRCAQPCRLPYTMNGVKKHFLSPADLCTINDLPALIQARATSLKIEGRLKRPEYVAIVTAAYRRALDRAIEGRPCDPGEMEELLKIFNRGGFTRGYINHKNDAGVMATARPNHWGVKVGKVLSVKNGRAKVQTTVPLQNGDGLEARGKYGDSGILVQGDVTDTLRVPESVRAGDELYRTTDAEQLARAKMSYQKEHRQTAVDAVFTARIGQPATLTLGGQTVAGEPVQEAKGKPLTAETVRKQVEKLGDTVLVLGDLHCDLDENAFLPMSALNAMRREAAEMCENAILAKNTPDTTVLPYTETNYPNKPQKDPLLILQSSDIGELLEAENEADERYFAPADFTKEALTRELALLPEDVAVVLPCALNDRELEEILPVLGRRKRVCGNLSQLNVGCVADVGCNAMNGGTMEQLMKIGASRVTVSSEYTLSEAERLARRFPVEMVVFGNTPLMTLRHCPIRTEKGLDEKGREDCRLCGRKGTTLTDRKGETLDLRPYHSLTGCRMQVFSVKTFCALEEAKRLSDGNFAALRVIGGLNKLKMLKAALQGKTIRLEPKSITTGHLYKGVE